MSDKVLDLVLQFLEESGFTDALAALQQESGRTYNPDAIELGGQLLSILDEHQTMKAEIFALSAEDLQDKADDAELQRAGENIFPKKMSSKLGNIHSVNILTLRFHPSAESNVLVTGATDKTLKICDYVSGEVKRTITVHTGPPLSLDFHPKNHNLLLSASMDKSHCIFDISLPAGEELVQKFNQHSKYVVRAKWHPDGDMFVTASYDKSLCVYKQEGGGVHYTLFKTVTFPGCVEGISFSPDGSQLIASIRDDNYLHIFDTVDFEVTKMNMNSNGDDHVSFCALDVSFLPDGKHILVSTDHDKLILFRLGSSVHRRTFYGAVNDIYSQPRHAIHPSGKYIYSTSQDNNVCCWDVATQKLVEKLEGHTALVRDLHYKASLNILGSCSFDKSILLWE